MRTWCAANGVARRREPDRGTAMTSPTTTEPDDDVRDRLAIALDVPDLDDGAAISPRDVAPWFGVAKVGLELYSAAGPEAIARIARPGVPGVLRPQAARHPDHRRPGRARARPARRRRTSTSTRRAASRCCARASTGVLEGAQRSRARRAGSARGHRAHERSPTRPRSTRVSRTRSKRDAAESCARCRRSHACKRARQDFVTIVPGVRLADGDVHDQARVGTPSQVARAGARRARDRSRGRARRADRARRGTASFTTRSRTRSRAVASSARRLARASRRPVAARQRIGMLARCRPEVVVIRRCDRQS